MAAVGVVVAFRVPPASIHGSVPSNPAAEKMEFPVTVKLVEVASVEDAVTVRRLVMVEVPEFTRIPPVNERRVEVASPGKGQEYAAAGQVVLQVSPVMQRVVAAKVVEVASVVVPLVLVKLEKSAFVAWRAVAKKEVEVALVVVAFKPVKLASVEEANEIRPP